MAPGSEPAGTPLLALVWTAASCSRKRPRVRGGPSGSWKPEVPGPRGGVLGPRRTLRSWCSGIRPYDDLTIRGSHPRRLPEGEVIAGLQLRRLDRPATPGVYPSAWSGVGRLQRFAVSPRNPPREVTDPAGENSANSASSPLQLAQPAGLTVDPPVRICSELSEFSPPSEPLTSLNSPEFADPSEAWPRSQSLAAQTVTGRVMT
jgi:hypothetical protein